MAAKESVLSRWNYSRDVLLNVYDIHHSNSWLYDLGLGVYHSGIEIVEPNPQQSYEYSFSLDGIAKTRPRLNIFGKLRATIKLGVLSGSPVMIDKLILRLASTSFTEGSYDLLNKNCNHFTDAVSVSLLDVHIPSWVNRLAYLGSVVVPTGPPAAKPASEAPKGVKQTPTTGAQISSNSTGLVRGGRIVEYEEDDEQRWTFCFCGLVAAPSDSGQSV